MKLQIVFKTYFGRFVDPDMDLHHSQGLIEGIAWSLLMLFIIGTHDEER